MWVPRTIYFTNLLSHSDTLYNFKKESLTIVEGENTVSEGTVNNGAGKSTLFEAIVLALDGTIYRKVGREEFIKYGQEECTVEFIMDNDVLQKSFKIERTLHISKSAKLTLSFQSYGKNWEKIKDISTVPEGNKKIYEIIGIQKTDIENFFIISQGNKNSFFTAGDIKQKEIISRFSNFTVIDQIEEKLKTLLHDKQSEVIEKANKIEKHSFLIQKYEEERKEIKENFKQEKEEQLQTLQNKESIIEKKLKGFSENWVKNQEELQLLTDELQVVEAAKVDTDKLESEIEESNKQRRQFVKELAGLEKELTKLTISKEDFIECPGCKKKFIPNSDLTHAELTKGIQTTESLITKKEQQISALKSQIQKKQTALEEAEEIDSMIRSAKSKIRIVEDTIKNSEEEKEQQQSNLKRVKEKIKEVEKLTVTERLEVLNEKVELEKATVEVDRLQLEKINEDIAEYKMMQFHFSKKGFKTYLANKSIRTIQDICNFYLKRFENNLQVEISGYKVLKNDEVRDKIDVSIYMDGISSGNFNRYSGGEKSRVELVGIIAINRLINNGCEHGKGLDLLVLDEYVDALDVAGAEELVKILSKCKITSLVILQKMDKLIEHPNVIKVIKNETGSFIKQ